MLTFTSAHNAHQCNSQSRGGQQLMFTNPGHQTKALELANDCAFHKDISWPWSETWQHQLSLDSLVLQGSKAKPCWEYLDLNHHKNGLVTWTPSITMTTCAPSNMHRLLCCCNGMQHCGMYLAGGTSDCHCSTHAMTHQHN